MRYDRSAHRGGICHLQYTTECDRISRVQRVNIFGLTYRHKAKSPHPNQVVKTSLHTFQKHSLFEVDGHARACKPLRRLATNAAINAPPVPKALLQPHFHGLPNHKATWKAHRLERAGHILTASADSRQRAARAATTTERGDAVIAPTSNWKPRLPIELLSPLYRGESPACRDHPVENPAASRRQKI